MLHVRLTWKMQDRRDRRQYVACLDRGVSLAVCVCVREHS